jgi:hypothetical protein
MSGTVSPKALRHSLVLLGIVVLIALIGLAFAGNWPKLLRVGLAAASYAAVLVAGSRLLSWEHPGAAIPYWLFAVAGAVAGLVSGVVRPTVQPSVVLVSVLAGAFLLSTVHWAGVRRYNGVLTAPT